MTLTFNTVRSGHDPTHMQEVKVKDHSVQTLVWKQKDGWSDGWMDRAEYITCLANAICNKMKFACDKHTHNVTWL